MMNPVRIIIDSASDVRSDLSNQLTCVPLTIHFGEETYVDGITLSRSAFYEKLVECDTLPTTSQATPFVFEEAFREAVQASEDVVAITISSRLSGTYQSAVIAAEEFPGRVYVVDSASVAIGSGILAQYALELRERGLHAADIAAKLTHQRENVRVIALLDTLEYLKRGGRISAVTAIAGGLLSIKPVIAIEGGEVKILGKARGSRQGNNLLVEEISKAGGVDFTYPVMLGYTGLSDSLLQKYIQDSTALWEGQTDSLPFTLISGVVGTHVGPGAIAVAFFQNEQS